MGGKGYKSYTSLTGKKVSGDWEDSDRGAGNKATRRAGGKVKKKSPTYQAYVLNKEHHQKDAEGKVIEHGDGTPSSVEEAKVEAGRSDYGKASVRNKRKFGKEGEPAVFDASGERGKMIDQRRAEHKAKRGVKEARDYGSQTSREGDNEAAAAARKRIYDRASAKDKDYMDAREIANQRNKERDKKLITKEDYYSGTGEKVVARTKKWMKKKGQKGAPGLDAMRARAAEHKAKRGVKEEYSDREMLAVTKGQGKPMSKEMRARADAALSHHSAMRKKQKEGRGVKEEVVTELNRYGKETGKATGSINKRAGTPVKKGGNTRDKALLAVRKMIRRDTGKPEGQQKKAKGEKGRVQYGDRKTTPADSIAKRRASKAAADAAMRDTSGT